MVNKIDSNTVGLRIAEEVQGQIGVLPGELGNPGTPNWVAYAPNQYGEFGSTIKTQARNPISAGRQRLKGNVVDLDAVAGFQIDYTTDSMFNQLQGFMFADWRLKPTAPVTAVSGTAYTVGASATSYLAGDLVFVAGSAIPGNNGLKTVTGNTSTTVQVAGLTAEAAPPATMQITKVGIQAAAGDITVTVGGGVAQLNSTVFNFTTLGLIPGEWFYIGGDAALTRFDTVANNGFARVASVTARAIVLDRQPVSTMPFGNPGMAADTAAAKTIRLFTGHVIKNEADPGLIKTRSYQQERSMGVAGYEYVIGTVPNTMEIAVSSAQKITVELGYIGLDTQEVLAQKAGNRPALVSEPMFNSTSDFSRLRTINENTNATLYTYLTEMRLTINNGLEPAKSVAQLGGFDINLGDFAVAGTSKVYFTSNDAVLAVRNNADVSTDFAIVSKNVGWLYDVPLLTLGGGRRTVEKDKAVMMDLTSDAAAHPTLSHTLLVTHYPYLPNVAQ